MGLSIFRNFLRREDGAISIIGAIALPVMIGAVALAVEFGNGLLTKSEHQRVADLAAYAGALAYSSTNSQTSMSNAAKSVAAMNGIPAADVTATLISSPRTSGSSAVSVTIASTNQLFLARAVGNNSSLPISSNAAAEITAPTTAPCIIALSSAQSGVTLSGGTTTKASSCSVASNASLTAPCGTKIIAKAATYNTTSPTYCTSSPNIVDSTGKQLSATKVSTPDPLATDGTVASLRGRIPTVADQTAPGAVTMSAPTVTAGTDYSWSYDPSGTTALTGGATGCSKTSGNYDGNATVTCNAGGTYTFGNITFGGNTLTFAIQGSGTTTTFKFSGNVAINGAKANFAGANYIIAKSLTNNYATINFGDGNYTVGQSITNGSGTMTFGAGTFSIGQTLSNSSGKMTFGAGTFNIAGGLSNGGSGTFTFGAGTFNIGASSTSCGGGTYSICNTSSSPMTFAGPSTFVLPAGVYNGGGATVTLGSGTTNSFRIGPSSNGYAINIGGGSKTTFADATGQSSLFQVKGNIASGGGSCLWLSAATQHDINGWISTTGGTTLGSGIYTINGYMALGDSSGGAVSCNGTQVGLSGSGVTLVISGTSTPTGSCAGYSFCASAGYSYITLTAPASNLAVIGPATLGTGAYFTAGASGVSVSGAFYFPSGPITLSGGASLGDGSGQCLELIGSRVTLSGGTAVASTCITSGSSGSSGGVTLVQ